MAAYFKTGFWQLPVLIFILLLFCLCACTAGNPDAIKEAAISEKAVGEAISEESSLGSLETIASESGKVDHPITEEGITEVADDIYLAAEVAARAAAQAAAKIPKLWIECSPDKEIQAKYDIMHENACKTIYGMNSYNQYISRVLYEYLQKNEPGKENRLVENFNEWYSTMAEWLQKMEEDERINYFTAAVDTYTKPITAEIEGKFANACEYTQYLFTHARYMFHFWGEFTQKIKGIEYAFGQQAKYCTSLYAYPANSKDVYVNWIDVTLDGSMDIYLDCVRTLTMIYKDRLYKLDLNAADQKKYPGAKQVLYELEQDKLNYKSVCEIK